MNLKRSLLRREANSAKKHKKAPLCLDNQPQKIALISIKGLTKETANNISPVFSQPKTIPGFHQSYQQPDQLNKPQRMQALRKLKTEGILLQSHRNKMDQVQSEESKHTFQEGWNLLFSVQKKLLRDIQAIKTVAEKSKDHKRITIDALGRSLQSSSEVKFSDLLWIKRAKQTHNCNRLSNHYTPFPSPNPKGVKFRRRLRQQRCSPQSENYKEKPISLKQLITIREPWNGRPSHMQKFISFSKQDHGWEPFEDKYI